MVAARALPPAGARRAPSVMAKPPTPPPYSPPAPPAASAKTEAGAELGDPTWRLEMLSQEADAETDRGREAVLRWGIGQLYEQLEQPTDAVKSYLAAYNLAPGYLPPLRALIRLFERRRSFNNLSRLYDAAVRSATEPSDRGSALLDHAIHVEVREEDAERSLEMLKQAAAQAPESAQIALALERAARKAQDPLASRAALQLRARTTRDPVLRALLLHELADAKEADGDHEGANAALEEAAALPAARWRTFAAMERIGRQREDSELIVRGLQGMAELALTEQAEGTEGSGAFSVERFADEARASGAAAAKLHEAALHAQDELGDAPRAAALLKRALEILPGDVFLRRALLGAARRAGDVEAVRAEAKPLLEGDLPPEAIAPLLHEVALASRATDPAAAYEALAGALQRMPGSPALRATRDAWRLEDGADPESVQLWVAALEAEAKAGGEAGALSGWRAATLASRRLADFGRAKTAFEAATLAAEQSNPVLRDFYEEALRHGALDAALGSLEALLARDLEPEERSSLLADRVRLHAAKGDPEEATMALKQALMDNTAAGWAPMLARIAAAEAGDMPLLARAHRALAERADDDITAASHFAASARATARSGDAETAIAALRAALDRAPGHRYAVSLLEELLRATGRGDEVVKLLREAADAQAGPRGAMTSLLLAGAAAEASGDLDTAADTYEQAADRDPNSVSPLHALARIARERGDEALLLRAQEALSQRELAVTETAGMATLELGEHYVFGSRQPSIAEAPLRQAMASDSVALEAAVALMLASEDTLDPGVRLNALEKLMELAPEATAPLRREHGTTAAVGNVDAAAAEQSVQSFADEEGDFTDRWALLMRLWLAPDASQRADAYLELSQLTADRKASDALLLHSLRAAVVARGADAMTDAFLWAQELAGDGDADSIGIAAAVALDEALQPGDDADARADALRARAMHASPDTRSALRAAAGRAMAEARRSEAVTLLRAAVREEPADLASWEALRVAARDDGAWDDVVEACDVLAAAIDGPARAELLEEAGAVLMDHLGSDEEAERRLRKVFDAHPERPNAYHRLHDLVAERGDTQLILDIVSRRIDAIDDGDQLERLFYEMARIHRANGAMDRALEALENLYMLDDEHVGGLALAVEIHVSREEWREAVDSLRVIAHADVPAKQKRISLLGASDFLDQKLGDAKGALEALSEIVELGLGDATVHARRADVAERAGDPATAAQALLDAAEASTGPARGSFLRRAGAHLRATGDTNGALLAYRQALSVDPIDAEAATAVAELLPDPGMRQSHGASYEAAVREVLRAQPVDGDLIRELMHAAEWRDDRALAKAAREALVVLRAATDEEKGRREETTAIMSRRPKRVLTRSDFASVAAPGDDPALHELLIHVEDALDSLDGVEPVLFGVTKSDMVSARKPHEVRDEVFEVARFFTLEPGELYHGGNTPDRVATLPGKKERIDFVVAGELERTPLQPEVRFKLGMHAMATARHTRFLLRHAPLQAAALVQAAAAAAETPLAGSKPLPGVNAWTKALQKPMSRRTRKAIAQVAPTVSPDSAARLEASIRAARRTLCRAGLLACMDLETALVAVMDEPPSLGAVRATEEAADLVAYWLSPELIALRKELGLV